MLFWNQALAVAAVLLLAQDASTQITHSLVEVAPAGLPAQTRAWDLRVTLSPASGLAWSATDVRADATSGAFLDLDPAHIYTGTNDADIWFAAASSPPNFAGPPPALVVPPTIDTQEIGAFVSESVQGTFFGTFVVARIVASDDTSFTVTGASFDSNFQPYDYSFSVDPAECFLLIGDDQGRAPFSAIGHTFQAQVGGLVESHAVSLDSGPEFVLPIVVPRRVPTGGRKLSGAAAADPQRPLDEASPAWMDDGTFAVQVVMWNPTVFPATPEQCTQGLLVQLAPDGQVTAEPYGTDQGGMQIWHELGHDADGRPVLRFKFSIPGF